MKYTLSNRSARENSGGSRLMSLHVPRKNTSESWSDKYVSSAPKRRVETPESPSHAGPEVAENPLGIPALESIDTFGEQPSLRRHDSQPKALKLLSTSVRSLLATQNDVANRAIEIALELGKTPRSQYPSLCDMFRRKRRRPKRHIGDVVG